MGSEHDMIVMMDEFISGSVDIPHYAVSEPTESVATQLTTPKTTRKHVALADSDNNRSTEDKPADKVKEKKQSKKQKNESAREAKRHGQHSTNRRSIRPS